MYQHHPNQSDWNFVHFWYILMEKKSQSMKWRQRKFQRDIWNLFKDRILVKTANGRIFMIPAVLQLPRSKKISEKDSLPV